MKVRSKRFIVISTGLAALAAAGVVVADWPLIVTHYHLFRLDRAKLREDAIPHIDALLLGARNPRSSALVAASLGTRREALTYWVFQTIAEAASPETNAKGFPLPLLPLAAVRPWLASLGERLERDDGLLRAWAHFVRWRELDRVVSPDLSCDDSSNEIQNSVPGFIITVFAGPVFDRVPWPLADLARSDPEAAEAWLRLFDVLRLSRAWTLGAPITGVTGIETPVTERNVLAGWRRVRTALANVIAWRKENRSLLRLDPEQGRCVVAPRTAGAGDRTPHGSMLDIPEPAEPLPGWTAPVLETRGVPGPSLIPSWGRSRAPVKL